jgi:putative ABC transport system ATP-binding protein
MPMLKIENGVKIFNLSGHAEDEKIAMDHLNLEIEEGEWVTIIGGNGSGKSTLMNVVSGVHQLEEGHVFIDNIDVTKLPEYKRAKYLGRVFQDPNMGTAGMISIEENMSIASRRTRKNTLKWGFKKEEREKYRKMIASLNLGLEDRLLQKVGLLSGGQRQAVTLLMATLQNPKILLLDEHTAALDPKTARIVLEITEKIVTENKITTLMITHNMKDAIRYGNRLLMLNNGKIILDIKGEEKNNLTIEQLLAKFEAHDDVSLTDAMILSK